MLTLFLLRHAKAAPGGPAGDFVRPLTDKGRKDAARLGVYLADRDLVPARALVSPAARTRQTFELLGAGLRGRTHGDYIEALFTETATQVAERLRAVSDPLDSLMVVGHNPSIQEAAIALTTDGDLSERQRLRTAFPPCSLAILSFETDKWSEVRKVGGHLDLFVVPDDLVAAD